MTKDETDLTEEQFDKQAATGTPVLLIGTRPATNSFKSCPATTGPLHLTTNGPCCTIYTDGAHRCKLERTPHLIHPCLCNTTWYCATPTIQDQHDRISTKTQQE